MNESTPLSGHLTLGEITTKARLQVDPPGKLVLEDAQGPKVIRLKSGNLQPLYQSLFLVIGGEKREIIDDLLPEDLP